MESEEPRWSIELTGVLEVVVFDVEFRIRVCGMRHFECDIEAGCVQCIIEDISSHCSIIVQWF